MLWQVTPHFAEWISSPSNLLFKQGVLGPASRCLELGSGVSGVVALALAPHIRLYTATDQGYVLKFLRQNIEENTKPDRRSSRKGDKRAEAEERQRLANAKKPMQKRVDAIEKEIARLTGTRDTLDAWLASEAAYSADSATMLGDKTRQRGEIAAQISTLEDEWMEKNEEMQWTP